MNLLITSLEPIASRLGMTLMHSLWEGAIIAAVLATILHLPRVRSASVRYAISCGAMLLFVLVVVGTFVAIAPASPQQMPGVRPPLTLVNNPSFALPHHPLIQSQQLAVRQIDPMRWLGFAWLAGTLGVTLWHLAGWFRIYRSMRNNGRELDAPPVLGKLAKSLGIRRIIRLLEVASLNGPGVVGVIRPVILIPLGFFNDLTPEQVEAILLHELAHIRRHDYLVNLFQVVVESLLFHHPATWWISAQIRREREHCCDDIAVSRYTAKNYVSALLALEQRRQPMANAMVAATGGTLLDRAERLLGRSAKKKPRPIRSLLAAAFAAGIVLACSALPIALQGCDKSKPLSASAAATELKSEGITDDDLKPDYSVERIGPGDVLEVVISDLTGPGVQTIKKAIVSAPDGTIAMPLISKGIKLAGLTDVEAQLAIAKAYRDAQIISNAQVSVSRIEARSTMYTVLGGGVVRPGELAMQTPDTRLTTALVGSDTRLDGQKTILITRRINGSATRTLRISVSELMAGDANVNVFMRPGDVVLLQPLAELPSTSAAETPQSAVVESGKYYVAGNASIGGIYPIPPENITLKQAIIVAGAAESDAYVSVTRREQSSETIMLQSASVHDLNSGAIPDMIVHPGDTLTLTLEAQKWQGTTTQQTLKP